MRNKKDTTCTNNTSAVIDNILDLSDKDSKIITDYLSSKDKTMAKIIQKVGPFHSKKNTDATTFDALVRSIIYQQLNGRAAASIHKKFLQLFKKNDASNPRKIISLDDETLKSCGLSRPKLNAIRSLCEHQIDGLIPDESEIQKMNDDEIIETLTQVKGIGVWTAQMILMFHLGRPDILPILDFGVRKGFELNFMPKSSELKNNDKLILQVEKRAKNWAPYRSVASWYLWRIQDIKTPE